MGNLQEGGPIDILTLSHFINYLVLGIFIKNRYTLAFIIGIIWEVFEYTIVNIPYTRKLILKYWPIHIQKWEGISNKMFDLLFNMLGYYVGNKINI